MTDNKMLSVASSPHIKHSDNTRTIMLDVLIALIPAFVWAIAAFGLRVISVTLVSVASCIVFEYLYQKLMKKPITCLDFSAAVTGVLIAFNLPVTVALWIPVMGSFFAIIIVKQLFGGIGKNIVNPALAARVFLFTAWPAEINGYIQPLSEKVDALKISVGDIVAGATPLSSLKLGEATDASISDLFMGNIPGCIGEISAFMLILGGIWLLYRRVITWHIPVAYLGTVVILTFLFPQSESVQAYEFMLMELCSGGLMLGAIFMATDYVTSPVTTNGRIIYGIGCGAITVFIRYFGGYNEGCSFGILIMNLLVWYIDKFTRPKPFGFVKKKKGEK